MVADVDEEGDSEADERTVVESEGEEVDGRTVIHGAGGDVEREASDLLRQENAEVVTKISADEAETDVSTKNEGIADDEEETSDDVDDELDSLTLVDGLKHVLDGGEARLVGDHLVVEVVTGEANDEDDDTVDDAGGLVVATEEASQELGLVLGARNDVPHEGVEQDVRKDEVDARVLQVDGLLDLLKVHHFAEAAH